MSILRRLYEQSNRSVGLFVDGPNVLREEFDVDLDDVRTAAEQFGRPAIRRLYLDEHAPSGLIQAAESRGFEVIVTSTDVDVRLSVDLTKAAVTDTADIIAIVSRDADFKPAIEAANSHDRRTVVIAPGVNGRSDALRNAADTQITLGEDNQENIDVSTQNQSKDAHGVTANAMAHQENQTINEKIKSHANVDANVDADTDTGTDPNSNSNSETAGDAPTFVGYDN